MIKILAIGNSFSEDATYYLHQILDAAGVENLVVNLYIGGCPLERHWMNIERCAKDYQYQMNGTNTERCVSIQEVLSETTWDVIITQQASHDSGWMDTYEPYLGHMVNYLKKEVPGAKLFLNQTWAYAKDSNHDLFGRYNRSQKEMFERLSNAYGTMAEKYNLSMIPSGNLVQKLRETEYFCDGGSYSICRDGYHMHYIYGRYAIACMWAKTVAGIALQGNSYVPSTSYLPDEVVNMDIIHTIQKLVDAM